MTSKTTTKAASPKATNSKTSRKTAARTARKKSSRINRQRRLQKQLQILLLERHSRRCIICHHPEREAIEEEFVHWRAPWKLSQDYKLADYRTVYRHARAAGLLLQRRERLHSALDAFVESVDDVTFTGDTILRAMRAYSCIDAHGRWTEIPTQVQFSTNHNAPPPQPSPRSSTAASGIPDVAPKYSNHASRSDATTCASPPAQAFSVSNSDDDDGEPEENEENAPEERVTALDVLNLIRKYANQASPSEATTTSASSKSTPLSGATACAASPAQSAVPLNSNRRGRTVTATACADSTAQAFNAPEGEYDELEDDDSDADEESEEDAEIALEQSITSLSNSSKSPSRNDGTASSKSVSRSDNTACAAPPAQAVNVTEDEYADPEDDDDRDDMEDDPNDDPDDQSKEDENNVLEEHVTACAASSAQALPRDVVRGQTANGRIAVGPHRLRRRFNLPFRD